MFYKLALKNARKSMKDYTIFFLTVAFGVCLFYMFNSLDAQTAMMQLNKSKYSMMQQLTKIISYISVFVAVILGFLIIYANRFLIKRRKKELGLYMTLGMERGKISRLLNLEMFLIALLALAAGLVAGVFLSQGLSVLTAKMFQTNLTSFRFVFSAGACRKTLLYFGIMFLIVLIFNAASVSRLKLIDLLTAGKKNETLKIRKLWISVVGFIAAVVCLVTAYVLIIQNGMMSLDWKFKSSIILGIAGTFLFFFSLSGFLLRSVQSNKRVYYKGLNMFILRQFNSKINTTFVSISIICLMLLITISTLSSGIGTASAIAQNINGLTPYDVSLSRYAKDTGSLQNTDMAEKLKSDGVNLSKYASDYVETNYYTLGVKFANLPFTEKEIADINQNDKMLIKDFKNSHINAITLSNCNHLAKMQGKKELVLKGNQFAIVGTIAKMEAPMNRFLQNGLTLSINWKKFQPVEKQVISMGLVVGDSSTDYAVLPDDAVKGCPVVTQVLCMNYKHGVTDSTFIKLLDSIYSKDAKGKTTPAYDSQVTKQQIIDESAGISITSSYVAIYVSLVFLIAGAAILALQQLSESSDNAERYSLLRKLGTDEKMLSHALFTQIGLYFLLPLLLAIVHSIVGISVVNHAIAYVGHYDITQSSVLTVLIFAVVYGGYFLATYFGSKGILRQKAENT